MKESPQLPAVLMVGRTAGGGRIESHLYGMLWSADADPVLLASGQFRAEAELCAWLRAIVEARALVVRVDEGGDPALREAVTAVLRARH